MSQTKAQLLDGSVVSVSFGAGSAAAPSINYSADSTTGIYFPGSGQLAISTSGSGRLFVSASGNVGIGTASSGPLLLVNGTPGTSTTANLLSIRNGSASNANNIAQIDFWCANTYGGNEAIAAIRAINPNAAGNNGGALVFAVSSNGTATTPAEAVRIDQAGNLGLGVTPSTFSVGKALEIGFAGNTLFGATSGQLNLMQNASYNAAFKYVNTAAASYYQQLSGSHIWYNAPSGTAGNTISFTQAMTLTAGGNLGVGSTADPGGYNARLWIENTADTTFTVNTTGSTNISQIVFRNSNANGEARFLNGTGGPFTFYRSFGNEAARIDTSGRLLVGTSTARSNIYLGTSNPTPNVQFESVTNSYSAGLSLLNYSAAGYCPVLNMGLSQTNSQGTNALIGAATDFGLINFVGNDGGNFRSGAWIQATTDGTPASGSMPGRLVFATTASGSASPTEAMRINNQRELLIGTITRTSNGGVLQVSNGITFPATQSACTDPNTLDDYEEGTWTPTQGTGVTAVGAFASAGSYVKIGKQVSFAGYITAVTSVAFNPASGTLVAGGLPFSVLSGIGSGTGCNISVSVVISVVPSGTAIYGGASIAATTVIYFAGTYPI